MTKTKTTLCAFLLLMSLSLDAGPDYYFFTIDQVNWMGSVEFSYEEVSDGLARGLKKHFGTRAVKYSELIIETSIFFRLDPIWLASVVWTESSFNPKAISFKGARGLMQLMPATAKEVLEEYPHSKLPHWLDGKGNLQLGSYYLKKLLLRFNGNHRYATLAYNLGTSGLLRRMRKSGVPKLSYWTKINYRYKLLVNQVMKSQRIAKTSSVSIP